MTASSMDDLEAVRTIVETLGKFEESDKERILRWALEKLGMSQSVSPPSPPPSDEQPLQPPATVPPGRSTDIKSFVLEKRPASDNQFAAVVAYFYKFEAPESQRKNSISGNDLQEAARQAGTKRLARPGQTLINAHQQGYFDKAADGYSLNTVGENLVAMALPENGANPAAGVRRRPSKPATKKSAAKKK